MLEWLESECEEKLSKELPILFNTEMVQAILEGRKTVTRRVIKFPTNRFTNKTPKATDIKPYYNTIYSDKVSFHIEPFYCCDIKPPYHLGDTLYVRETWYKDAGRYMYRANYAENESFIKTGKKYQLNGTQVSICQKRQLVSG